MVDETVYVAIAIACVVALLVLVILIIYCIKRQQDKWNERIVRERRRREERQRRNFQRAQIVQPPSYEVSRVRNQPNQPIREIPWSPPPEYKELATPIPGQRYNHAVGIGGVYDTSYYPPGYSDISSVSRNVAPVYTYLPPGTATPANNSAHNHNNNSSSNINNISRNNNRNLQNSRNNASTYHSDNAIQVQVTPRSILPDVVTSTTGGNGNGPPISTDRRAGDTASLQRPANTTANNNSTHRNARSTTNNGSPHHIGRSTVRTASRGGAEQRSTGALQSQNISGTSRQRSRTPQRSSSRSTVGRHNETTNSSAVISEAITTPTVPNNQIPPQFQDLSLI